MMKIGFILTFFLVFNLFAFSQDVDTELYGKVSINQDPRLEILSKKLTEYNEALELKRARTGKGFRLLVLTTSDRTLAMNVRSTLIQRYPEQKVYMFFQSPFIKLRFGNFLEKKEAEDMQKQLAKSNIINGNIYIVPDTIEIRPEPKNEDEELN